MKIPFQDQSSWDRYHRNQMSTSILIWWHTNVTSHTESFNYNTKTIFCLGKAFIGKEKRKCITMMNVYSKDIKHLSDALNAFLQTLGTSDFRHTLFIFPILCMSSHLTSIRWMATEQVVQNYDYETYYKIYFFV